jgi:hypothetical protein
MALSGLWWVKPTGTCFLELHSTRFMRLLACAPMPQRCVHRTPPRRRSKPIKVEIRPYDDALRADLIDPQAPALNPDQTIEIVNELNAEIDQQRHRSLAARRPRSPRSQEPAPDEPLGDLGRGMIGGMIWRFWYGRR